MASPYPVGDLHLLFFASFLAHSVKGQKAKYSLRANDVCFGPNNGHRSIGSACPFGATNGHRCPQAPLIPAHKIGRKKARLLGRALIHWVERGE